MPPPTPLTCSVTECQYTTPEATPTWEMMFNQLNLHTQAVHGVAGHQAVAAPTPTTSKLEKLPRPTFTLNSSEATWNFTKTLWDAYIGQTVVSDPVKPAELTSAVPQTDILDVTAAKGRAELAR